METLFSNVVDSINVVIVTVFTPTSFGVPLITPRASTLSSPNTRNRGIFICNDEMFDMATHLKVNKMSFQLDEQDLKNVLVFLDHYSCRNVNLLNDSDVQIALALLCKKCRELLKPKQDEQKALEQKNVK